MIIRPRRLTPGYFRLLQVRGERGRGEPLGTPRTCLCCPPALLAVGFAPSSALAARVLRWSPKSAAWGTPKAPLHTMRGVTKLPPSPSHPCWVQWRCSGHSLSSAVPVPGALGSQRSPLLSPPQMQLAAGRGAEPGGRLLTPLALLLAAAGLCLSIYSARRMAGPAKAPPQP